MPDGLIPGTLIPTKTPKLYDLSITSRTTIEGQGVNPKSIPRKMNRTTLRTRYGLIIEKITAIALEAAGYSYRFDHQYDENCICPDFTIPDSDSPDYLLEVTQTDSRDSLRMKSLRYLELVAEAKISFGSDLVAISTLFGLPGEDLQETFLTASLSPFDAALIPRVDERIPMSDRDLIGELEALSLDGAEGEDTVDVVVTNLSSHPAVRVLAQYFRDVIPDLKPNPILKTVWELEATRLSECPPQNDLVSISSRIKKSFLQAIYLNDDLFSQLLERLYDSPSKCTRDNVDTTQWPEQLKSSLIEVGAGSIAKSIRGGRVALTPDLKSIFDSRDLVESTIWLREVLESLETAKWYFYDIRDESRCLLMADTYIDIASKGREAFEEAVYLNLTNDVFRGITHSRCWIAELLALDLGMSQSALDNQITRDSEFRERFVGRLIGCPFRDTVMKFAAIMNSDERLRDHAYFIGKLFEQSDRRNLDRVSLANKICDARKSNAVKLKHFNPLLLTAEKTLQRCGWVWERSHLNSLVFDLLDDGHAGRFSVYVGSKGDERCIINVLQIIDAHKPKEWAARGRALRYRLEDVDGKVVVNKQFYDCPFIFVLDGNVSIKMRTVLENAGWRTCTIDELDQVMGDLG